MWLFFLIRCFTFFGWSLYRFSLLYPAPVEVQIYRIFFTFLRWALAEENQSTKLIKPTLEISYLYYSFLQKKKVFRRRAALNFTIIWCWPVSIFFFYILMEWMFVIRFDICAPWGYHWVTFITFLSLKTISVPIFPYILSLFQRFFFVSLIRWNIVLARTDNSKISSLIRGLPSRRRAWLVTPFPRTFRPWTAASPGPFNIDKFSNRF